MRITQERVLAPAAVKTEKPVEAALPAKTKGITVPRSPVPDPIADEFELENSLTARLWKLEPGAAAAFFCGSLALCLASVPALYFLTKPLSAIGLVLGLFAGLLPALKKNASLLLPGFICLLSLLVLLFVGRWPKGAEPPPPPLVAVSLDKENPSRVSLSAEDWTNAATHAVSLNDFRVHIKNVDVEEVDRSKDHYLVFHLQVNLDDIVYKVIPYEPWADSVKSPSKHPPILTDNAGRSFPQKTAATGWASARGGTGLAINPSRPINDVLVFQIPPDIAEEFRLRLPAGALGQSGEFRFQIPRTMLEIAK